MEIPKVRKGKEMSNRSYAFFGDLNAAVAMDEQQEIEGCPKVLTFALAFCTNRDQFNKQTARNILNGRIDDRLNGNGTRLTFQVSYVGAHSRRDAMALVLDAFREHLSPGPRSHSDIVIVKNAIAQSFAHFRELNESETIVNNAELQESAV